MDERCTAIVGACCSPFLMHEHCPLGPSCRCDKRHHQPVPGSSCGLIESEHEQETHTFKGVPVGSV